jgi:serine/threonine protein kinase
MHCAQCGHELQSDWTACPICGWKVGTGTNARAVALGEVSEVDLVREALTTEYEIVEELGRGGMAIVYRARDRQLDREVAVKVLPFSLAFDAEFVERFQREARTAAQLEHPNIIPIYRVGRSGQVIYFVMKYLRGQSLSELMAKRGRLEPPEIRRFLIEAGRALNYASKRGIVHRDIKPDNIMFDEHGTCVVTDFGIAKAATGGRLTGTGMSIGTPHYMSPEQARAQATDGRSDMYSLGVVAYQCLVGAVPFDGEDSFSIGYKHIMDTLPEPQLVSADERRIWVVIRRLLAKDPQERFQTGAELIEALEGHVVATGVGRTGDRSISPLRLASMPTSPMPSQAVDPARRPAMQRPAALREENRRRGVVRWVMLVLAVGFGGLFAGSRLGVVPIEFPTSKSTKDPATTAADPVDSAARDPVDHGTAGPLAVAPPPVGNSTAGTTPTDSIEVEQNTAPSDSSAALPPRVPASPPDSGALRITGLPRGSIVWIDDQRPTRTPTRLSAGSHVLLITHKDYVPYTDTVVIEAKKTLQYAPTLRKMGTPLEEPVTARVADGPPATCERPGPGYNKGQTCWDVRARPLAPPRVPVPAEIDPLPPASIWAVKVSEDGRTMEVYSITPSTHQIFEALARSYATQMLWSPATKDGKAVVSWTQTRLEPIRP